MRLLIVIGLALLVSGCGSSNVAAVAPSATAAFQAVWAGMDWVAAYSQGVQAVAAANNLCYFDFPIAPGHIDYLIRQAPPLVLNKNILMSFTLTGNGAIIPGPNSGTPPARARLFFQRAGDDFSALGPLEFYRWWSVNFIDLSMSGSYSPDTSKYLLTEMLTPDRWTSVYGKSGVGNEAAFAEAVANAANVGITFGADFAGHGDMIASGSTRFTMTQFEVL